MQRRKRSVENTDIEETFEYYSQDATAISKSLSQAVSKSSSSSAPSSAAGAGTIEEVAALALFPLGSWERHVVEERLRAIKRHECELRHRAEMEKECTFQPRVTALNGRSCSVSAATAQRDLGRRTRVFARLAQQAKEREARIAQLQAEKEQKEEEALHGAFKPHVNEAQELGGALRQKPPNVPVEERLLHYGKTIEESRRLLREERRQEELKEIRGGVVARKGRYLGPNTGDGSIAYRSQHFIIERERERALAQKALLEQHPFHPKVCTTSNAIDRERRCSSNNQDRGALLYAEGIHRQRKRQEEAMQRQKRELNGPRKPTTSPLTNDWIYHGQHRPLFKQDFVRRQELYQQVREEHQRQLASALEENNRKAAQVPRINPAMIEEQVERLYLGGCRAGDESKKGKKSLNKKDECSFRPQLAPGTAYVIAHSNREPDVVKRLAVSAQRRGRAPDVNAFEQCNEETEGNEARNRTKSGRTVRPEEAEEFYQRQKRAVEERQAQMREQKQRLAMEELFACTFRPKTSTDEYQQRRRRSLSPEKQQDDRVEYRVSGVAAYLQRQADAKQKRAELQAKYENLGRPPSGIERGPTVIKPFNLSSGRASVSRCLKSAGASPERYGEMEKWAGGCRMHSLSQREIVDALGGRREPTSARCRPRQMRESW